MLQKNTTNRETSASSQSIIQVINHKTKSERTCIVVNDPSLYKKTVSVHNYQIRLADLGIFYNLYDHLTACICRPLGHLFNEAAAAFPDLRNYFGEYNVIMIGRPDGQNNENKTQVVINSSLTLKAVFSL